MTFSLTHLFQADAAPTKARATGHTPDAGPTDLDALDIAAAMRAHQAWKEHLNKLLASDARDALDPLQVCRDDICILGKWINGPGQRRYHGLAAFERLCATHAEFHGAAASVLALAQQGRDIEAHEQLQRGSFARASLRIEADLAELFLNPGAAG